MPFTDVGAWHFIADLLERGEPLEEVVLHHPPGAQAYVMRLDLGAALPRLYIKVQLSRGKIIGRSFHYSD
jgi:hypothetical protein